MLIPLLLAAAQPAGADPALVAAAREWTICLSGEAERLTVAGAETAAVAGAALAACTAIENAMVAARLRLPGAGSAEAERAMLRESARAFVENRTRVRLAAIAADPVEAANAAHGACIGERVGLDAVSTSRPAAAIMDDALAACRPLEERLRAAIAAARGAAEAEATVAAIRQSSRASAGDLVANTRRSAAAR